MHLIAETVFAEGLSFDPWWWEAAPRREVAAPPLPGAADVAIVGSGYTGLSAALTLARAGRSVIVLESREIGHGASSRNGGAVGETLRHSYTALAGRLGREAAIAFYHGVREARAWVENLVITENIDCRFARVGRFVGAHRPADYGAMARDTEARRRDIGFDADMVPRSEMHRVIGSDAYHGGRLIHSDANLHPALFHQGLLERVLAAGATVVPHTPVVAVRRDGSRFRVATGGPALSAGAVIMATNGYTGRASPWLRRRLVPIQSQIIATEPLPRDTVERLVPGRRQLGDTRRLHNYYRTSPDGARILFGGRAGAGELRDRRRSATQLHRQMIGIFPDLERARITHAWAGFIAYTFDALPHMVEHDGVHYCAGYCGSGVAMAPYLGHKTALKVLGSRGAATPFDHAYRRMPGYTGTPWFLPAAVWALSVRDRLRV
ncbi:MAG: FAD-binding oxidoreductase [Burkholderiales bacterium]|nr:FAD-binding oxidoreductase [Burkholderiales bacterium]